MMFSMNDKPTNGQMITLNIRIPRDSSLHSMQVDVQMSVADLSHSIQQYLSATTDHDPSEYGVFVNDTQQAARSYWLEPTRALSYYHLKNNDEIEYRTRYRPLKIRLLDETVKTILIDDSLIVAQLMVYICTKFGIANHDEYSLVYDLNVDQNTKTATLRRDRSLQRVDKKMEELRKKCHTDDDTLWLDQSKTLRQQEIDEQSTVVLRRKYFFSDTNIDQRDPVQLNLLYVQCRNGIVDGTHPVTLDEAVEFSGLQCQIEFGDHQESKHKASVIDLRDFLPKEYIKTKNIEKRIFLEHKKHLGLAELDGKVKYTHLCRSLRTYGVTFFLVKEKLSGKNKLVPRLLGVTKESIIRVDERTKDFLQVWPLTHVKRWTASPNTFTLDFGDYASAYYSVQTHEGQQISQLIAGYIDIILKKRKDRDGNDRNGIGDEEATMIEDVIAPGKATIIQPNRPLIGFVQQQHVHSPPILRGTFSDNLIQSDQQPEQWEQPHHQQQMVFTSKIHEPSKSFSDTNSIIGDPMLISVINSARTTLHAAQTQIARDFQMDSTQPLSSLMTEQQPGSVDNGLDVSRHALTSEIAAINASIAQVIILTADFPSGHRYPSETNSALATAISAVTNNLYEFSKEIHLHGNPTEDTSHLFDQTGRLCATFDDLLSCIQSLAENNHDPTIKQNILLIASRLGEITQDLIRRLSNGLDCSIEYHDRLLALAKSVANTTAVYVLRAKDIASHVQEQQVVNEIISTATQCALATSQLVACTKVVAATIASPLCQEQLIESARGVTRSIEAVLQACVPPVTNEQFYSELSSAGRTVRQTLNEFLLHIKLITDSTAANSDRLFAPISEHLNSLHVKSAKPHRIVLDDNLTELTEEEEEEDEEQKQADEAVKTDQSIEQILIASDRLFSSIGDATEMVKQAKILAQSTAQLVSSLRHQAESIDDDTHQQQKFLTAAKMLADATAKMVESAKGCATRPTDTQSQYQLKRAVEELRLATHMATSHQNQRKIFQRIEQCAKYSASCATQCIAATSASAMTNRNQPSHQQLVEQCKIVADLIPKVVQGIRTCMVQPSAWSYQMNLIHACEDFYGPARHLADLTQTVVPTIHNQSQALHLNQSSKQLLEALTDLRTCLTRGEELCASIPVDIESIIQSIDLLERELTDIRRQVKAGQLKAKTNETVETSSKRFSSACRQLNTSVGQLLDAISRIDEKTIENCARTILDLLREIGLSTRNIAATTADDDQREQNSLIDRSQQLLQRTTSLLREARKTMQTPNDATLRRKLSEATHQLTTILNTCINTSPSQRYLDDAMKQMSEYVYTLAGPFDRKAVVASPMNSDRLNRAADQLNQAATDLVISTRPGGPDDLATTSVRFSQAFGDFIHNGLDFVHHQQEEEKRSHLLITLKNVHASSNQFLERAKSVSTEPLAIENDTKQQLATAARAVTDTIHNVISACLSTAKSPGLTIGRLECDQAIREMETSKVLLEQSSERPCTSYSYFEALDHVVENSKRLGEAMTHIASASKNTNHQLFLQAVQDASRAVCHLVEASAQASYLIGVSEANSRKESSTLLDQTVFNRSVTGIRKACSDLSNSSIDRNDVLTVAATIAKNTSALCNTARDASTHATDPVARRRFVQSAKDVANATAELVRTIKVLDGSYTSENHRHCVETSRPLIQAVDDLHAYATSREFSNTSSSKRSLAETIVSAARSVVDGACRIVECSKILIINSKEASLWQQLATHTKSVSESIKRLATSVKEMTPGQRECDFVIDQLRKLFQQVDQAIMHVDSLHKTDQTPQFHQEQIVSNCRSLLDLVDPIRQTSKRESEQIGLYVSQFISYFKPAIYHTIDYISCLTTPSDKVRLLEQSKSIVEISLQLILSSKESAGNVKNLQWHRIVDNNSDQLINLIHKLLHTFEGKASSSHASSEHFEDSVRRAIADLETKVQTPQGHFLEHQTRMTGILRQITRTVQEIAAQPNQIDQSRYLTDQLARQYQELSNASQHAIVTATSKELAHRIKRNIVEIGFANIEFIDQLKQFQEKKSHVDLGKLSQQVTEKISQLVAILQPTGQPAQACYQAANTVNGIIADLDTTILFAASNKLDSEHDGETFADHREAILKTAKALVEDTKTLVAGAASSPEQLASAAQAAVRTITKLVDVVKSGAASVGVHDGQIQVMLINSVKDVALALNNLINVTKSASGKTINHPDMKKLKESAKVMVTNVTSLLRTVKIVEDKAHRGTHALETTIESIGQELQSPHQEPRSTIQATPEDLIRVTRQITIATSKAVIAGQSGRQEDILLATNLGRKATSDLLLICKSTVHLTNDRMLQQRTLENGRLCVKSYQELLETIHHLIEKPSNEAKQNLVHHSRIIAQAVQELVRCAGQWKGTDLVDPDDSTYVAESELLHAAQSIESAAKKLSSLKPRRQVQEINENLNFDEQILEAAKSIMNATSTLMTAATFAQKELVVQGKLSSNSSSDEDGQWSEGLISAARYVASACHVLCDAANGLVQGCGTEEKLISCAKQVSSNTAALLVACKVKADFMSPSMTRLQTAGNAVKRAADALVRAAQQAVELQREEKQVEVSTRFVPGIAQEIKCKEAILTKERELDEARSRLKAVRLAKYGHTESESNEST